MEIEIKVRFSGDLKDWENIPVSMRTRELTADEKSALLDKLKKFAKSEFIVAIRWNETGSLQGHYFNHQPTTPLIFQWLNEEGN